MKTYCAAIAALLLAGCQGSGSSDSATQPPPYVPGRVRVTSLEESPPFLSTDTVDRLSAAQVATITVDYDCFSNPTCTANARELKRRLPQLQIRVYFNPMEEFCDEDENAATCDPIQGVFYDRPFQKELRRRMEEYYPGWFLKTTAGERFAQPAWPFVQMMNLSSRGPKYEVNGVYMSYSEYIAAYLYEVLSPNLDIISGIEMDNLWGYLSWYIDHLEIPVDANNDGMVDGLWDLDGWWREGYRAFIAQLRLRFSDAFIITGRGQGYHYRDVVDSQTYELPIGMVLNTAIGGSWFGMVDRGIILGQLPYSTLNETNGTDSQVRDHYALCLITDSYCALDLGSMHGGFQWYSVYGSDIGLPQGVAEYPFALRTDTRTGISGFSGTAIADSTGFTLYGGRTLTTVLPAGKWKVVFDYQILMGKEFDSRMALTLPDTAHTEVVEDRWQDGEFYRDFVSPAGGTLQWSFSGPGYLKVTRVRIYDMSRGTGYFQRDYARATVYYNASVDSKTIHLNDGSTHVLDGCGSGGTCGGYIDMHP